jgi:WD40 repeat protein
VTDVAYAPCGRLVVLATADHLGNSGAGSYRVLVWSAATGRLCTWHDAHAAPVTSFAWEQRFASVTENPTTDAAEADAATLATLARERRDRRRALEENVVVTACEDGALRLWALRGAPQGAGKPLHECWAYAAGTSMRLQSRSGDAPSRDDWRRGGLGGPPVARGAASCVARSPGGGGLLATAHVDGTVRVLDASSFRTVEAWSLGAAQRACAWAPVGVFFRPDAGVGAERRAPSGFGEGLEDSFPENADENSAHETTETTTAHLLASGGCDGTVRVWRVEADARLDAVSWRDPDEGVVAAIGPGDAGRGKALPASTLVGVSGERVSLALEAFGGENSTKAYGGGTAESDATPFVSMPFSMFDHRTRALPAAGDGTLAATVADGARNDPYARCLKPEDTRGLPVDALAFAFGDAAAAAAEKRVAAWRVALAESESATRAASAARRAYVRERFPRMTPSQRRAYNAAYAERMAPLRARRARFWNLVQSHGYGTEDEGETNASDPNETSERETEL